MNQIDFYHDNRFMNMLSRLHSKTTFNHILEFIYQNFKEYIPFERVGLALLDEEGECINNRKIISEKPLLYRGYEIPYSETELDEVIHTGIPRVINNLEVYSEKNPCYVWPNRMLGNEISATVLLPLRVREKGVGVIFFCHPQTNVYNQMHLDFLRFVSTHISTVFEKSFLMRELALTTVMGLANLAEKRDMETGQHIKRIKYYSRALAVELATNSAYRDEIDEEFIQDVYDFSPLHDIGKVGVSDAILRKPARLSPEEFEEMKKHPIIGKEILEAIEENLSKKGFSFFKMGIELVYSHQEKFDGSGYPRGLKGKDIPLVARLVSVCDVFDACSLERIYKEAYSLEECYRIVETGKGSHFDPVIVDAFMNIRKRIEEIYHRFRN
ncbi:MAG: HD domain-containing protein [Candidatus Omnitrophica bacterium]|nr:HD domain-containing protein [Candidatus Omnitrophota bacterium]